MSFLALALGALAACAQEGTPTAPQCPMPTPSEGTIKRNIAAVRLTTPPTIDGDLSDPAWQQAAKAERFVDWLRDHALDVSWEGGRFEEFDDSVYRIALRAHVSDPFHNYGLGYSWGRQAGDPITFLTPFVTWRFGEKLTLGLASSILRHTEDAEQHVFTFNYDLSPERGIGGRLVAQTGGTNGYLAYRQSGYGGVERFLILGDPNAAKFKRRIALKVVWPM